MVFTRTKHRAKALARQLNAHGVPRGRDARQPVAERAHPEPRGVLRRPATTLVATDIAARGIHVDDVALVIHADPPVEHKAYLHRSGRTARAGNDGTVVTLMLDAQVRDVRDLTRKAGIAPTVTELKPGHPLLQELAPGQRTFVAVTETAPALVDESRSSDGRGRNGGRSGGGRSGWRPCGWRACGRRPVRWRPGPQRLRLLGQWRRVRAGSLDGRWPSYLRAAGRQPPAQRRVVLQPQPLTPGQSRGSSRQSCWRERPFDQHE